MKGEVGYVLYIMTHFKFFLDVGGSGGRCGKVSVQRIFRAGEKKVSS